MPAQWRENSLAQHMPDPVEALEEGIRAEKLGILERALAAYETAAASTTDPDVKAEALTHQADVHRARCEWEQALGCAARAKSVAQRAGLPGRVAEATNAEALVFMSQGNLTAALPLIEEVATAAPDVRLRGIALQNLGTIKAQQGQLGAAERAFAESYGCFQQAGYARGMAIALNNRGRIALDRGEAVLAEEILDRALEAARSQEDGELIGLAMVNYAEAILRRGDHSRAEAMACSALGHFEGSRNIWRSVECLRLLGAINQHRGNVDEAARCYERALGLARGIGARVEISALEDCLRRLPTARRH
jgi:tetratricopeptide (TPR) repeat protein